ncbi:unspecified product [Leishmania tarentolae]|uniref:Unspecified product n=1 Tax=Leishmania tarentolae TaxID=5689 RepID=A0A640KR53_LEITA|nr:unspecified product [Leishmania tarentolae]
MDEAISGGYATVYHLILISVVDVPLNRGDTVLSDPLDAGLLFLRPNGMANHVHVRFHSLVCGYLLFFILGAPQMLVTRSGKDALVNFIFLLLLTK